MINIYIGPTTRKGKGLFTRHAITKGTAILEMQGPRLNYAELVVSPFYATDHYFQIGSDTYIGSSGGMDDMINHSCNPNCGIREEHDRFILVALQSLTPGTEITFDYSTVMNDGCYSMTCECGSEHCRRTVGDFKDLPDLLKKKYLSLGIVLPYIAKEYPHLIPSEPDRRLVPVRSLRSRKMHRTMAMA